MDLLNYLTRNITIIGKKSFNRQYLIKNIAVQIFNESQAQTVALVLVPEPQSEPPSSTFVKIIQNTDIRDIFIVISWE